MISNAHAVYLAGIKTSHPPSITATEERAMMIACARAGHVTWLHVNEDIYPALTEDGELALRAWRETMDVREMGVA